MQTVYIRMVVARKRKTSVEFSEKSPPTIRIRFERWWLMRPEIRDGKLRRRRCGYWHVSIVRPIRPRSLPFPRFCCTVHGLPRSMGNEPDGKIKSGEVNQPFYNESARNPTVTRILVFIGSRLDFRHEILFFFFLSKVVWILLDSNFFQLTRFKIK